MAAFMNLQPSVLWCRRAIRGRVMKILPELYDEHCIVSIGLGPVSSVLGMKMSPATALGRQP
eukprot:scaffold308121_cov15-Tisochrysis_lutea.AAC.1